MSKRAIFLFSFIFVGLLFRIYLATTLPIWHDEAYSIWASQHSVSQIIRAVTDPVHPPGYYLLLHFWAGISDHLYWLRLTSIIAFLFNAYLLKRLGEQFKIALLPPLLVFLYSFSGYFIIFDWQVRMYSITVTFIFLSLVILNKFINDQRGSKVVPWIFLTIVNTSGLYIDYGYFWYFIPLVLFFLIFFIIKRNQKYLLITASLFSSGLFFLLIHPSIISTYNQGVAGIAWLKPYLSPAFFVPYFFGTHRNTFFTISLLAFSFLGITYLIRLKKFPFISSILIFSSSFSFLSTLIYSLLVSPIFHVRSLQIIGITTLFLVSFSIYNFRRQLRIFFILLLCTIVITNFILIVKILPRSPGQFLISFFPWKQVVNSLDTYNTTIIRYQETRILPTPLLLWGLQYTLSGKESYPIRKIQFGKLESATKEEKCILFYDSLLELYSCT
ncbi:MAG: hypothetical protein UX03_C0006G0007 [Candidatus Woesebacteria bacterium GW2011_GWE1_45_18]|nr:MAG: hypothetical protein UX03_C0006G0007 [Candidatus Woesebacteria bacterium GW2011_GWE1_45_18]